jgi:hypothetical protein
MRGKRVESLEASAAYYCLPGCPFPRWRPQLGAKPVNISINAKLLGEREPMIGQTLIDTRGRKPAWEGILRFKLRKL